MIKKLPHHLLKLKAAEWLASALKDISPHSQSEGLYFLLGPTPSPDKGDLAFPLFTLAKECKKSPPQLATTLMEKAREYPLPELFLKIEAHGPYLNFFTNVEKVAEIVVTKILDQSYFSLALLDQQPKTMIEYSQPNTHKELHVGHMRNLCLGSALINLHRYCGFPITSSTFPGDVGTHVAKCLWYLKYHLKEKYPVENKGAWLGTIYTKANNLLEEQRGTPTEETNRQQLTEILAQLEKKEGAYFELWKETREWSIQLMKDVYDWAQVNFDVWFWESEVDSSSVKLIQEYFKKGLFIQSEGAIGADLSPYNLGFCLLIKSDGNGLYATKDVELARRKFLDYQIEKSIYVVDTRQSHHFKQVFKILELMEFPYAKQCFHLAYDFVELPDGAMSSRKGNIIPLQRLIEEMIHTIKTQYLHRYENEWSKDEINLVANQVARGAIKYGMTKIDPNKKIVFEMSEWLKLDGDSGPYLQYTHARMKSLLSKVSRPDKVDYSLLVTKQEHELLKLLPNFNEVVVASTLDHRPNHLTNYLFDLCRSYNAFYAECPVASAAPEIRNARYNLTEATRFILKKGLELLGIEAVEKM